MKATFVSENRPPKKKTTSNQPAADHMSATYISGFPYVVESQPAGAHSAPGVLDARPRDDGKTFSRHCCGRDCSPKSVGHIKVGEPSECKSPGATHSCNGRYPRSDRRLISSLEVPFFRCETESSGAICASKKGEGYDIDRGHIIAVRQQVKSRRTSGHSQSWQRA